MVWVVAGEGVVQDLDVEAAAGAHVLVASAAPVLPLPDLRTTPLFPHLFSVVEASRVLTVVLQSEIAVLNWIVFSVHAVRASDYDVV